MGDADDLYQSGLRWGWADEDGYVVYPAFEEPEIEKTRTEHWMSRSRRTSDRVCDAVAEKLASEIVSVKEKLRQLHIEEKHLKSKLAKVMPTLGWILVEPAVGSSEKYIVEHVVRRRKPQLKTRNALKFIANRYGREAALQVAEHCSEKYIKSSSIYVRPFGNAKVKEV